jgi:hypothetical protein
MRGENALHGAALRGADTIVQFLIDQGTDVNATSKQGYTPLDVAMGKTIVLQLPVPQESTGRIAEEAGREGRPGPARRAPACRSLILAVRRRIVELGLPSGEERISARPSTCRPQRSVYRAGADRAA